MKLLHVGILLLAVIQFARSKPLNSTLSTEEQLEEYYGTELKKLSGEICPKLKYISDQILQDQNVQQALTPLMQEFKKSVTRFQQVYPVYTKYNHNGTMVSRFSNMLEVYYDLHKKNNKDAVYIIELIRKLGYDEIREKYKSEFRKVVSEKFLPKYEELKRQISNHSSLNKTFTKLVNKLTNCQEYECYLSKVEKSSLSSFFENFVRAIVEEIIDGSIIYMQNAIIFAKEVVKDPKMAHLSSPIRLQLLTNLQDIIRIHESVDSISKVIVFPAIYQCALFKFDNHTAISVKDRRLITNIFDDHGYAKLDDLKKDDKSLEHDYFKDFDDFKVSRDPEEVKRIMDAIDRIRLSATVEETNAAYESILHTRASK